MDKKKSSKRAAKKLKKKSAKAEKSSKKKVHPKPKNDTLVQLGADIRSVSASESISMS